jgi:hemoglobin/transferrin/lactoferrin receptor protein
MWFVYYNKNEWKYNLILSSGFRAPNQDDFAKVFDSAPGKVVIPNEALKPEFSKNIETVRSIGYRLNYKKLL